ncbi:MAG: 23S rRNA (cytosine(1962)-C(5))-methyltransferase [Nitrospira sp.]|jgi:23S rRNA (cytosine1962-C5)-methyltransferase|nr:MAG: 23S rRNA (cytosine(1962)-C(5))-methyltransferase [Nitrospira sp.]
MTQTAQVRLTASRGPESRHLWLYAGHLGSVVGEPVAGDLIDVLTSDGRFYGRGFYNPASKIRVRLLTFQDEPIDETFWLGRIQQAIRLRKRVVVQSNAYRLIYGEADRLPGLIVDRYGQLLVMQTLSAGMDRRKELLADFLMKELSIADIYLRNDAKSRQLEGLSLERGFLRGSGPTQVEIHEGPAKFLVDVERGQKTGWFCDQRENRLAAARLGAGAEVLEVFCHTGAFGIHATLAGAISVESLDVSQETLEIARRHAVMNHVENRCIYRQADAFEEMRYLVKAGRRYDVVILDPPAFARSKPALPGALAGYKDINLLGLKLLKPDGFLVTCSCSHPVSEADFWNSIRLAARDARRDIRLIEQRGQSADHPILASMPETRYLKCFIVQVL